MLYVFCMHIMVWIWYGFMDMDTSHDTIFVVGGRVNAGHVRYRAAAVSAWFARAARATNIAGKPDTSAAIHTGINGSPYASNSCLTLRI